MRPITITPVLNGFVVDVGCQRVVFGSILELSQEITRYFKHPEEVEKEYCERAVNKPVTQNPPENQPGMSIPMPRERR